MPPKKPPRSSTDPQYFATLPSSKIGDELIALKDAYYKHLETSGHWSLLKFSHMTYFKSSYVDGRLQKTGENMEYTEINVNHYRNLLQHMLSLVTGQRPQFEPKAANTDYKSQAQTQLASGLLDYYMRSKKLERYIKCATESSLYLGEGWVYCGWSPTSGEQLSETENGAPIYEGDLEFANYLVPEVIRDVTRPEPPHVWLMTRSFKNKFDLAAKYPELAERILAVAPETYFDMRFSFRETKEARKDDIPVYTFFHSKTESVPDGRIVEFVDSDIILVDGPLPYREIPLYRIVPSEKDGSVFGYTNSWDLLPLQQAMDKLHSTVVTNQAAFGVQNIMVPKGNDLDVTSIIGGLNMIEYDAKAGPPQPLQLSSTSPETIEYIGILTGIMETLSGINSVARGNPESSLKSGSALALVQSMAIQFSQSLQQSYAQLLEDVGTSVVNLLRDYATVPRIALIAGKSMRSQMKQFKGDDLAYVQRVLVDMGNPMMRTTAGRVNLAEQLIQAGLIQNPQQYLQVVTTGRVEPIYEGETAELNLIRSENESLMDGKPVMMVRTDNHPMHIMEHKVVLSSPEARAQPELVALTLSHIEEHEMAMAPPPGLMPMAPGGPSEEVSAEGIPATPPEGTPDTAEFLDTTNPVTQEAAAINMPRMPEPASVK